MRETTSPAQPEAPVSTPPANKGKAAASKDEENSSPKGTAAATPAGAATNPNNSTNSAARTPARNNYAAPHTPIASAKRPRSSMNNAAMMSPVGGAGQTRGLPETPLDEDEAVTHPLEDNPNYASASSLLGTPGGNGDGTYDVPETPGTASARETLDRTQLSPLHPAKPPIRKSLPKIQNDSDPTTVGGAGDDGETSAEGGRTPGDGGEDGEDGSSSGWVGRQVEHIFSPMLNFLSGPEDEEGGDGAQATDGQQKENGDAVMDQTKLDVGGDDDDVVKQPASDSTSHTGTTSQETLSEEEDKDNVNDDADVDDEEEQDEIDPADDVLVEDDHSSQGSGEGDEDDEDEFNPYAFIKSLPAYELVAHTRPQVTLPPKKVDSPPISLVLDLDETLVHCTVEPTDDADLVFPVEFHGMTYQVNVRLRPHLMQFLKLIKGKYEVIVFTASQKVYANELLNLIDPEGVYFQHRLYRESCLAVEGNFLKDLTVLDRDLTQTVLVDNSPHAFGYQVDNGIPIESWFDDPADTELLKLERFMRTLRNKDDVRPVIRSTFRTYELVEQS